MGRLFVLSLFLASASSRANELAVTWLAPEACPADDELVRRVERLLVSHQPAFTTGEKVILHLERRPANRYRVVGGDEGKRTVNQ